MINQLLNREFVLDQLRQVEAYLAAPIDDRRRAVSIPPEAMEISNGDLSLALADVQRALSQESQLSSGQKTFERRGEEPPLDDWSFFSRDPVISNLQTALDYYFVDGPGKDEVELQKVPDSERRGPRQESVAGEYSIRGYDAGGGIGRRIFNRFSVTDIGWVSTALAAGVRLFRKRHPFVVPKRIVQIGENPRMILVGDWGTGIPRAQHVADQMRKFIDDALHDNRELHVIHLGDVYYSGWQREYTNRFLRFWPVNPAEAGRIQSWSLNGNHDMYSGGFGYYDCLLKDPRFDAQGGSSVFCLENRYWKIFGLDSAWEDAGLCDPQPKWLIENADPTKKTMLLSHHQPFSSYEKPAAKMIERLGAFLNQTRGAKAWYWGHEHRFMLFSPYLNVQFGRLVGHGGVPVYMNHRQGDDYPVPGLYEDRRYQERLVGLEHWAYFGFAVLDFSADKITARYIDEDGSESHPQETVA